jgi:hypothetical protein
MSSFPRLKSGAVLQYPSQRALTQPVRVLRFLDGQEQRYALEKAPRRRWLVQFDLLDDREAAALEEFVKAQALSGGTFGFEDPWSGSIYPKCRISGDGIELQGTGEDRNRAQVEIVEEAE